MLRWPMHWALSATLRWTAPATRMSVSYTHLDVYKRQVQLYVPQRGDKAHLVEMAHTNAVERLARESGRYAREEKLLDELAQVLGLAKPPRAIESYDISNWGDGSSVCGMVTFKDGKPYKAGYRKFKMKTVAGTDDYASLAETCLLYTSRCV